MAKKRAVKSATEETVPAEEGKVSLQLRLDAELHAKLKETAEKAGISLNQLINGICWGAIENAHLGEGKRPSLGGCVRIKSRPKCVFFGRLGFERSREAAEHYNDIGEEMPPDTPGEFWFGLDFTGRGVVQ